MSPAQRREAAAKLDIESCLIAPAPCSKASWNRRGHSGNETLTGAAPDGMVFRT
jgi:hypothetical protein